MSLILGILFFTIAFVPVKSRHKIFEIIIYLFVLILCLVVSWMVLLILFSSGSLGWLLGIGAISSVSYLLRTDSKRTEKQQNMLAKKIVEQAKARTDKKRSLADRINDIERSPAVLVLTEESNLYAIPLCVSQTEVILLYLNMTSSYQPNIKFSEIKSSIDKVCLVKRPQDIEFYTATQISSIAKDLYLNIEPQNKDLKSKLEELKRLEKLARFSELYKQQADLYSRASNQIQELLNVGENLSQECRTFILDILIGQELARYNVDDIPDVLEIRLRLDDRCKAVSDQYQILKSEMEEYMNLKDGI
jgi:hypothetical protein